MSDLNVLNTTDSLSLNDEKHVKRQNSIAVVHTFLLSVSCVNTQMMKEKKELRDHR